jgi:hypothetical protein
MCAITETEPGGEMVCIVGFSARPHDVEGRPIPRERRRFRIGERVRYITHFFKNTPEDNPIGYMAVFEPLDPKDKNRYAAAEVYFVSLDCWEGLRKHFASTLIVMERDPAAVASGKGPDILYEAEGAYVLVEAKSAAVPRVGGKSTRRRDGSRNVK